MRITMSHRESKQPGRNPDPHKQTSSSHPSTSEQEPKSQQYTPKRAHTSQHRPASAGSDSSNNSADTTSFSDLPVEVKLLIGHDLTQHQLSVCVRVCKVWKVLFSPALWRHVEDSASRKTRKWTRSRDHTLLECIAQHGVLKLKCRYIHSLRLECSDADFADLQARHQLPSTLPHLRSVEFIGVCGSDRDIARFIRRGSPAGWRQIIFRTNNPQGSCKFGKESVKEVLKHAATLEVLRVEAAGYLSSLEIQELLCGLPKLKEFFVLGAVQLYVPPDPSLNASDVVASRWVCTDLEIFGCTIKGVPRPDIAWGEGADDYASDYASDTKAHRESIHLQRQVCAQLGRLTKLRELILRAPYPTYDTLDRRRYIDHQSRNCLAMSLEGGLDLLHGLKELRKVGLVDMDVNIGYAAEQEWVKANWPHATIQFPGNPGAVWQIGGYGNNDDSDSDSDDSDNDSNVSRVEYDYDWKCYIHIDRDGFIGSYEESEP
ncbi:MAG: hypothetical protein J3R72DRAFT_428976 [Linnemannia gamsii]|nr:MAG: hypothetical protein J3R72DRAFT_428976 [Linnemannia gamsii]